jgi:hypothetical protein
MTSGNFLCLKSEAPFKPGPPQKRVIRLLGAAQLQEW